MFYVWYFEPTVDLALYAVAQWRIASSHGICICCGRQVQNSVLLRNSVSFMYCFLSYRKLKHHSSVLIKVAAKQHRRKIFLVATKI